MLLPIDSMLGHLPYLKLKDEDSQCLRQGKTLAIGQLDYKDKLMRLYSDFGQFFGLGYFNTGGLLTAKRLLAF